MAERERGREGGGEAAVTKEGSIRASARPGGFRFMTAEAEVVLAPEGIPRTNSRGGCRDGGDFRWRVLVLSIERHCIDCLPSSRQLWTGVPGLTNPLAYRPRGGGGKEVGVEPLPVEEFDEKGEHTPLDFGSRYGGGRRNKLEGGSHQVDVAIRQELNPLDAAGLRALSGRDEGEEPVPVEEPAKMKEVDDIKNRGVVGEMHVREGVCQRGE